MHTPYTHILQLKPEGLHLIRYGIAFDNNINQPINWRQYWLQFQTHNNKLQTFIAQFRPISFQRSKKIHLLRSHTYTNNFVHLQGSHINTNIQSQQILINSISITKVGKIEIKNSILSYSFWSSSISSFFWHPVVGFAMLNCKIHYKT